MRFKLTIALLILVGAFNMSAQFSTTSTDKTKALLRKWKYVMIEVPSVREMLYQASAQERQMIHERYAKALKGTYLKFNEDNTFEIRKAPRRTPVKGTWRFDPNNDSKLYMKEGKDAKEQEAFIEKLNRKQLVMTNGKSKATELVQIFLEPYE